MNNKAEIFGHPSGLFVLFFTEMWERFSYYGMRGLLVLYVSASATADDPGMGWSTKDALWMYGWYTMLVYVMSIPGGILADRLWGQKKAVMIGGLLLVAGHLTLALPSDVAFFSGLVLIILGVGCLKPNISTMVGGLYAKGDVRRDKGFSIFYMGINLGALLAGVVVGIVVKTYGWHYGFGLAGVGMLLGQAVYMWGQRYLTTVGNSPKKSRAEVRQASHTPLTKIEKDRILVLLISFLIVIIFWGAFEQAGGLLNLYTDVKINRMTGIESALSWIKEVPTIVFQSLNSAYIILFATLVAGFWIWRRKLGKEASSLFQMAVGTAIMGLGFVFMMFASEEASMEAFGKASMLWLFLTYLLNTIGELCISPVTMSFITKLAPVRYASLMMGIYFAATGLGNKLAAEVGESSQIEPYHARVIASKTILNSLTGTHPLNITNGHEEQEVIDYPANHDKNLRIKSTVYAQNEQVVFQTYEGNQSLQGLFALSSDAQSRLLETLTEHDVSAAQPYHAELLFEKNKTQGDVTGDGKNYEVSFVLEEVQNALEYTTFRNIALFSVAFAVLLIIFLRQLKRLTHGADDVHVA